MKSENKGKKSQNHASFIINTKPRNTVTSQLSLVLSMHGLSQVLSAFVFKGYLVLQGQWLWTLYWS